MQNNMYVFVGKPVKERKVQDSSQSSEEVQQRYQLVNSTRQQSQCQRHAKMMWKHEILHTVWVHMDVQYFTPRLQSNSTKRCIFMSRSVSSDSKWEGQGNPPQSTLLLLDFHQGLESHREQRCACKQMRLLEPAWGQHREDTMAPPLEAFFSGFAGEPNVLTFGRDWDAGVNLLPPTVLSKEHRCQQCWSCFLEPSSLR